MQPLLVLSIPHTGTLFTLYLLPGRRGAWPGPFECDRKYFCHLRDPYAEQARQECFTVVPVRHFQEVKASWIRHGMDLDELLSQWNELFSLRDVFFLPIDTPDREEQLSRLSKALGVQLLTEWRPTNSVRTAHERI